MLNSSLNGTVSGNYHNVTPPTLHCILPGLCTCAYLIGRRSVLPNEPDDPAVFGPTVPSNLIIETNKEAELLNTVFKSLGSAPFGSASLSITKGIPLCIYSLTFVPAHR